MNFVLISALSVILLFFSLGKYAFISEAEATLKTYQAKHKGVHSMGLKKKTLSNKIRVSYGDFLNENIPNTFDLRDNLTQIEDQGQCGSCWAFSLTATHRDGHKMNGFDAGRLSQQYLVDCARNSNGCGGGYFDAADYLVYSRLGLAGSPLEDQYPYTASTGTCNISNLTAIRYISNWHMLGSGSSPSVKDIQAQMVMSNKPVSITIAAGAGDWSSYSSGIYNGCTYAETDHMINIVGWDNEFQEFDANGNLPPGTGVWILRNSWGTGWGENGWMRMKMTDAQGNRCNNVAEGAAAFTFYDDYDSTSTSQAPTNTDPPTTTDPPISKTTTHTETSAASTCVPTTTTPACVPTTTTPACDPTTTTPACVPTTTTPACVPTTNAECRHSH